MKPGNIIKWAVIAFVVWWIVQQPTNAAHLVHNIGILLSSAASRCIAFCQPRSSLDLSSTKR